MNKFLKKHHYWNPRQ